MSAVIVVYVDGVFCESSYDVPGAEPDSNSLRWFQNFYDGSKEQFLFVCDSPNTAAVDAWLRNYGVRFSALISVAAEDERGRIEKIIKHVATQHAKIVLFIGARFYDCNQMADQAVPSLRYTPPNQNAKWQPDPRSSWVKAIEKQQS